MPRLSKLIISNRINSSPPPTQAAHRDAEFFLGIRLAPPCTAGCRVFTRPAKGFGCRVDVYK